MAGENQNHRNPVQLEGFRISGPVEGEKVEIQLDLSSLVAKPEPDTIENGSEENEGIGFLFLLLLALILYIGSAVSQGELTNDEFRVPEIAPGSTELPAD